MTDRQDPLFHRLTRFPRVHLAHTPTPVEAMSTLGAELGISLHVKRDDCTGIGFGGNKVRQLEFYLGAALAESADTVLITGAVQSNYVRTAAAMARRLGLDCHIQLEERVADVSDLYRSNGNVLLDQLLGAQLYSYPEGENEAGADQAVADIADDLRGRGRKPYIIPLGPDSAPLGALGYIVAAAELADQCASSGSFDEVIVGSGSALTHAGLLVGFSALGLTLPVRGVSVRRHRQAQIERVRQRVDQLIALLGLSFKVPDRDIDVFDGTLAPGYGLMNDATLDAIRRTARSEGPVSRPGLHRQGHGRSHPARRRRNTFGQARSVLAYGRPTGAVRLRRPTHQIARGGLPAWFRVARPWFATVAFPLTSTRFSRAPGGRSL